VNPWANADLPPSGYGTASPQRACPPKPWRRPSRNFTKGPSEVLDHATSEIAIGSKLDIAATKKLQGEGFSAPGRGSSMQW
jgi:hypothetical protein